MIDLSKWQIKKLSVKESPLEAINLSQKNANPDIIYRREFFSYYLMVRVYLNFGQRITLAQFDCSPLNFISSNAFCSKYSIFKEQSYTHI